MLVMADRDPPALTMQVTLSWRLPAQADISQEKEYLLR